MGTPPSTSGRHQSYARSERATRSDARTTRSCWGQRASVWKLHGLVLDRTKDAVRQAPCVGPGPSAVARRSNHPPPALGTWANLIEQQQRLVAHFEQHRVPAWVPSAIRLDARPRPRLGASTRPYRVATARCRHRPPPHAFRQTTPSPAPLSSRRWSMRVRSRTGRSRTRIRRWQCHSRRRRLACPFRELPSAEWPTGSNGGGDDARDRYGHQCHSDSSHGADCVTWSPPREGAVATLRYDPCSLRGWQR